MPPDEAADILGDLPLETSQGLLREMPRKEAQDVRDLLRHEENTAGGMMNTEFVLVGEDATRGEVADYVRFHDIPLDQLDTIFLINKDAVLAGTVPMSRLILAGPEQRMGELSSEAPVWVRPEAQDKEVFELFDKYNLRSLTVVDEGNHPIGAITVDDVVHRMHAKI